MAALTYLSVKKFLVNLRKASQNFWEEWNAVTTADAVTARPINAPSPRAKLRVSLNELKVISSALLHFKKGLIKNNHLQRAEEVALIDEKIYDLIQELEAEQNMQEKLEKLEYN
jgi:hypothetical protein